MRVNLSEIKLADGAKDIGKVQLLKAGKYKQWEATFLEITSEMLSKMKLNFDNMVKKIDLAIDYSHNAYDEAAGWIKSVSLENNGSELWCEVEWTEDAKEKILNKEFRYLSADFDLDYEDNETGVKHGVTLNGGGLTNRPFVKGMSAILNEISVTIDKNPEKIDDIRRILNDPPKQGTKTMNFEDLKKALVSIQLSDDQKKEIARLINLNSPDVKLSEEVTTLKKAVEDKQKEIVLLSEEKKALQLKVETAAKEAEFSVLLSEGKAVPAQKEAFLKGDMSEFLKLAVSVNLSEKGTGTLPTNPADIKTKEQAEAKVEQLSQEKMKVNTSLQFHEAMAQVLSENPELKKLVTSE